MSEEMDVLRQEVDYLTGALRAVGVVPPMEWEHNPEADDAHGGDDQGGAGPQTAGTDGLLECPLTLRVGDCLKGLESEMLGQREELEAGIAELRAVLNDRAGSPLPADADKSIAAQSGKAGAAVAEPSSEEAMRTAMCGGGTGGAGSSRVSPRSSSRESKNVTRSFLRSALASVREHFDSKVANAESASSSQLAEVSAALSADLRAVRECMEVLVGDGVEMRRQLLSVCEARERSSRPSTPGRGGFAVVHGGAELGFSKRDIEAVRARVDVCEQNNAKGLAMLHNAVEAVRSETMAIRRGIADGSI